MGAETHAKLMSSSEAVGLLAVLADSSSVALVAFGKQEIWRHVLAAHSMNTVNPLVNGRATPESCEQLVNKSAQAPSISCPEEKVLQARLKKVRFAPDVVEPAGNSRAYRGQVKANKVTQKRACADKQELAEKRDNQKVSSNDEALKAPRADCNDRKAAKPNLPANRMVLYRGKQLHRSMTTLDCSLYPSFGQTEPCCSYGLDA